MSSRVGTEENLSPVPYSGGLLCSHSQSHLTLDKAPSATTSSPFKLQTEKIPSLGDLSLDTNSEALFVSKVSPSQIEGYYILTLYLQKCDLLICINTP